MRLRSALLAAVVTAAPSGVRAQAGPPAFTQVFGTYSYFGCQQYSNPSLPNPDAPCVTGTATLGRLAPAALGVRLDFSTDWSLYRGPLPLTRAFLATESEFYYSTVGATTDQCLSVAGRFTDGRCVQSFRTFSSSCNADDLLPGQTATFVRTLASPFELAAGFGRPETLSLERVELVINFFDAQGSSSRIVVPALTRTDVSTVPEPSALALGAVGGLALAAGAAARRRSAAG